MGRIILEGMEFFAYHGFSDEEQMVGNKYGIDLYIDADLEKPSLSDKLSDTVDYARIYQIVADEMKTKSRLLEHIAHRIIQAVRKTYPSVGKICVHVSKFNPPVGGVVAKSKIILEED